MVRWSEPENEGPPINDYDYRYRTDSPQGNWTEVTNTTITELSVTISNLAQNTSYEVQIRAKSDEGESEWSPEGTGSTGSTEANAAPEFTSDDEVDVSENTTFVLTVQAEDSDPEDDIERYEIVGGVDRGQFSIVSSTGVLRFRTAPNFEAPQDGQSATPSNAADNNQYVVKVRATSGTGDREKTADQTIVVTVTDETNEKPDTPKAPSVSAASQTSLDVRWLEPENEGPPITDYDYRYKKTSASEQDWAEVTNTTITELSVTIVGLEEGTSYDVQIRATNPNGTSEWSPSGTGSTLESTPQPPESTPQPPESTPQPPESTPQPPESTPQPPESTPQPPESTPQPPESTPQPPESTPQPPESTPQPPEPGVIIDSDLDSDLPLISVTADPAVVEEGVTLKFTLTRIGDLTKQLEVPVRVTESGAFLTDEVPSEATFAVNATTATLLVATVDDEVEEENGAVTATITSGETYQIGDAASATVEIIDNDGPDGIETRTDIEVVKSDVTMSFARTRYEASEGDAALVFAVRLSAATLQEVVVEYATVTGTATAGMDYAARTGTLTFPTATTEQTIRVRIIDDDVVEGEETFTVVLRKAFNATIEVGEATGVIADNDLRVVVNIAADLAAVAEGGTAAFTLTREGDLTAPLTVPVRVTERGAFLTDEVPTEATFAANAATATLLVATDDDGHIEANGSVTATITSGAYQIGDAASATVAVIDNDVRGVTVTPTALTIREGSSASYMVGLDTEPTADVTVAVQVPEGAEVSVVPTALTFTAANWRTKQLVVVTAAQDDDAVADDPVTIRHAVSGGDYGAVTTPSVVVTILEDDPAIRIADAAALEGDGEMAFSVRLSVVSIQTVTVDWTTADGTAIAGQDYEATTGTLTFSALATTQTIRVPIIDDDLDEAAETFTVALSNSNVAIADGEATGVIVDNDLPVVSVTTDLTGVEEGETVAFTLTRVGDLTVPLTVPVQVTERGSFLADRAPTKATFAANAATTTLQVATDDDERDEADGAVTATITSGATHRVGAAASATVPVTDNDAPDVTVTADVTVTPTTLAVLEGRSANYTVVLDAEPTADVTIAIQVPEDAEVSVDETELTFTTEDWNQAQTVTVTAAQDADAVADDPVTIHHAVSGGNYDTVPAASVAVAILEDDMPTLLIADAEASEGDGEIVFQVRLSVANSKTVTTEYATGTGTATKGEDYEAMTGKLTFPALETEQTIRVPIIDDDLDEAAETFTVMLINASNATIEVDKATGVIADDDLPVISVAADPTAVEEGETVTFTVTRVGDLTVPLTVPVSVTERGAFLADGGPTKAMFAVGATTTMLKVATADDDVDEGNGSVTATIADDTTHRAGDAARATVPVTDNDMRGVTVTPTVLTIPEGGSASYTVVLTSESTADVTVAIQVPEGAEVAVDETELTFTAEDWNQVQTVTVTAAQDADAVADDLVTIHHAVSGGDYESVTVASVEVTIIEDDTPTLLIADAAAAESDGEIAFLVRLSVASSQTVTVDYATADGTAMAGTDYEETTGTLTFPALETAQTIRVPLVDDDLDEAAEAFTVALSNASNAAVGDGEATGVIVDNDLPVVSVAADPTAVEEGETVTFTLTRVGDLTVPLTVPVDVTERGAFLADGTPTEATFDVDAETATLLVATDDDERDEADGAVTATITDGTTHRAGDAASATVPVTDNDERGVTVIPMSLTVNEGSSASYTVVLNTEPTADVTVAIQVPDNAEIAVDETELTFTAEDWDQAQTVTVTSAQDADAVADDPVVLTHAVSGGDYEGVTTADVEVAIIEDDTAGGTISITALEVPEGDTGHYTIVLDTEPTADVTVAIQVPDNADITVSPLVLTFTADNWNTPQTVTVTAAQDAAAVADDPVTITHAVSGGDYEGVATADVEVTITEDDTAGGTISITALEVPEGDTGHYTIVLDTEPTADVTVAIQVPDNADITVSPLVLTFTADNWNTPQTVTVTAAQDAAAVADDPVTITHAVSGGDYEGATTADVEVSIIEDDTTGVTISITALEVPEGDAKSYTVVLTSQPTADATVAIQVPDNAEIAVDKTTLTFTAAHWNTPQTVAVTAAQDDDAVADDPVTLTHAVSGGDYEGVTTADVEVSITEDDTTGVTISTTALEVPEGETRRYTVVLDTEPTADVTVAIQVPEDAEIAVDQTELTFTAAHWNTPQTVAVTAAQDDDAVGDDPVVLTHAVSGGDYEGVAAADVEVSIIEDDTAEVTISTTALEVPEGDAKSYTVVLTSQPTADATVAIQVPDNAEIAVDKTTLTFTAAHWNTPQTVAVTAAQDDDAVGDDPVVLTHAVSGGDYEGVTTADVEVSITEDDTAEVTISTTALEVPEGETGRYTVVLDTEPTADVTVAIQVPDNAEIAVDQTELTFTAAHWNTPQTVTVTAAQDDDAVADDPVTLTHAVSGGDYEGLAAASVEVTITEDDTAEVTISTTALEVPEGETGRYTVVLDTEPTADVTVAIQVPEDAEIAVDQTELTFTAAHWNTPQTVAVTAAQDDDAVADDPVTLTHAVSGGDYEGLAAASVEVTITEDDTAEVTISTTALEVPEGETGRYTVVLDTEPTADVTVAIQVPEDAEIAVDQTELTFTAAHWNTPQTVAVTAAQDDDAVADDPVTITHAVSGGDYEGVATADVEVSIIEDDTAGVAISTTALEVPEGETGRYTVVLDTEPTADVTVAIQVPEDAEIAVDQTELTFTAAHWNTPQTVAVTANQDDDAVADDPVTLTHAVSGGDYEGVAAADVEVSIIEDDTAGVAISTTALEVPEGETGRYTIVLDTEPTADVIVAIQVPEDAEIAVDQTELTFTAAHWNTPQTVAVTAAQDDDAVADDPVTITHAVSGGDYEGVATADVEVSIIEDDTTGVAISITALEVPEGDTGHYTVVLDTEPIADVTVAIQVPDNADITVGQAELTFTAAHWNTPQTVAVTAAQDDDAVADDPVTLAHAVSGGDYEGVTTADVEVSIIEDDTTGVTISITALEVPEGDAKSYTVVLTSQPTADATVAIQVPDNAEIAVDKTTLTFTAAHWNTPQTVAVTAAQDDDAVADDPVVLTHAVSGGDYEGVTTAEVEVSIIEDDTAGVAISTTALEVPEGETGRYTVVLDTEPTADVTVAIQVPEDAEIAVDQTELTFTAAHWNTPQTVAVTAAQDDDAVADDPVVLTHAVSGGDYEGVATAEVEVSIIEDDTAGVAISTTALEVPEGETRHYTVVLDTEPIADVTVAIQVPDNADITVGQAELTFTAAHWNTPQTVAVTAAQDDDAVADDPVTITHAVSGGDYEGVATAEVEVTIIEDDTPGVSVSETTLTITEGDAKSYAIVLDTEPAADVIVAIQVPENADIAVDQTTLTFTAAHWNTPQTVAVTAAQDDAAVADDPVTITHAVSGGDYEGVATADVEVSIIEDDTAEVTISTTALEVPEGDAKSYTVVLTSQPTADVTVAIQVPDNAEIAVDQTELTFTAAHWNTPQTVAVTAAQDDDAVADDPVTITHAVSGGDYEGLAAASVEVSIVEDDTPGVAVSETALTMTEGDSQSYAVVLDTEPAADVTVVVAVPEDVDIAVNQTALTFTADNWNTPQTVTVTATQDDDAVIDDPVTLTHTVSGGDYEGLAAASVEVSITEDDTPALTIADANATESDEEITFTVRLNVASSLAVTVDWTTADGTATQGADYVETTGTLRFNALETEQTITVPLLDDALDEADETFTVALTNAANATLDDAEATGTIADNDDTPALTIADAEASEGDREITFAVTMGAVSGLAVTADWTTADGTATAAADYAAAEGRLTFAPGQTEATLAVTVFNDALDEGDETFTIALSNPSNAMVADGTATGTITDDDPSVEKAWLARFGRTTASQVMDAVSDRLTGRSGGDAHLTLGGQRVTLAAMSGREGANAVGRTVPAKNASLSDVLSQHPFYHLKRSSFADIISRSSFQLSSAAAGEERDVRWTAWGRGATTRFRSEEVDLSLTGGPVTALLGVDRQQGRMLAGLAVAHSSGTGEFDVHTAEESFRKGELGSYLTSVHPYLRVAMTERLSAWGLLGYGRGQMERMADRADANIGMQMGGLGARGALLSPTESSDFDVALKSDAFLVRMGADAAVRPALETMTSRLRLLLEGGRPVELDSGRMSPSLEVGVRHDGGDAETGLGLEVGGSLGYTHSQRGLALQATARRLLVHQANGYEEWGVGGSVNLDPGALGRGASLRMRSSWGASASGMDRLWSQRSAADLAQSIQAAGAGLFDAELGYGLDALGGLLTPYARIASSGRNTHTYGLGGRLRVEQSLRVDLVGERRERTATRAGHALKLRSTLYW